MQQDSYSGGYDNHTYVGPKWVFSCPDMTAYFSWGCRFFYYTCLLYTTGHWGQDVWNHIKMKWNVIPRILFRELSLLVPLYWAPWVEVSECIPDLVELIFAFYFIISTIKFLHRARKCLCWPKWLTKASSLHYRKHRLLWLKFTVLLIEWYLLPIP